MSRLRMADDVYLVDGYAASCIYDLRDEYARIYWLDGECRDLLRQYLAETPSSSAMPDVIADIVTSGLASVGDGESGSVLPTMTRSQPITHAWIEVTERCQLRCIYCYGEFGGGGSRGRTMTIDDADYVLGWIADSRIRSIQIIGGEPFINREVVRHLVRGLHAIEISIEIYTNGLLLKEDDLDFLGSHGVRLAVSIFGATEAEAAAVTGYAHTFRDQTRAVKMLESHGIKIRYSITRTASNNGATASEIAEIFDITKNKFIRDDIARPIGRASGTDILSDELSRRQYIRREYFSRNIKSSTIVNYVIGNPCFMQKVCISSSLDAYPCTMEKSISYGSIKENSAGQIECLSSDYRFASKDAIAICNVCEYRYACFDCRPKRSGGFYSKSTACLYDPHLSFWRKEY